jgi:transcriptional regulator with XRE-family HTH domain
MSRVATQPMHPLRLERTRKRLTQKMLADLTGLGEATIERAEGGARVSLDTQQRLCAFFHKTPQELGFEAAAAGADVSP